MSEFAEPVKPPAHTSHDAASETVSLRPGMSVALILPGAIGDSLIALVLANNLVRNGYRTVVFGWVAEELADWFPHLAVSRDLADAARSDLVLAYTRAAHVAIAPLAPTSSRVLCVANLPEMGGVKHMVDRIVDVAADVLGLRDITRSNGLVVPAGVMRGRFAERVVIHPTGSHPEKLWRRAKYFALSRALARGGLRPRFLVAPDELPGWSGREAVGHEVSAFSKLGDVAACIAESGWFIGNDSGLGHLASCIGVPTLSLFMRRGLARSWRPGWGTGAVVLPPSVLPSAVLKERLWMHLLSVRRVMSSFHSLRGGNARIAQGAPRSFADAGAGRAEMLPGAPSGR